jgi:endonuclease/exonuclease/phosphatase family metal-dependent hydrolase
MQLTLMSYNIKSGLWTPEGLEAVARVIAEQNPDVVALQEVDRNGPRTGKIDQAAWLGERLGYQAVFCPAMRYETDAPAWEYGIGLLSRRPIVESECRRLFRQTAPPSGEPYRVDAAGVARYDTEQRAVLGCAVDLGRTTLDVFCTHWSLAADQRSVQAEEVIRFCTSWHPGRPVALMGDFNALPDAPEIATLRAALVDAFERRGVTGAERLTFPSGPLGSRTADGWSGAIDYVFLSPHFSDVQVEVIRERIPASDHAPVVAHVELPDG